MKKTLLILAVICGAFVSKAQISVSGVSPAAIVGDYEFTWGDPVNGTNWGLAPNFNTAGVSVQAPLMLVEDGTPGTNAQGHPISQEGCGTLTNDLTGKIAVVYRNVCGFGVKAQNAEAAGAVGVIIVNRDNETLGMDGGTEGATVTIPVVMLSSLDGATLVDEMANGPVVVFMGNKVGLYANDAGSNYASIMLPQTGSTPKFIADNGFQFMVGIEALNYGSNTNGITVIASVDGPSGPVYADTVGPVTLATGEYLQIFDDSTYSFDPFDLGTYEVGDYILKYTISLDGSADDAIEDNVFTHNFSITSDGPNGGVLSRASYTGGTLTTNTYPSNAELEYKACMYYTGTYPSTNTGVEGFHFAVEADTALVDMTGESIFLEVWEWNDVWTTLSAGVTFASLNQVGSGEHVISSNAQNKVVIYQTLDDAVVLQDNQNYLFCLVTFNTDITFGAEKVDFNANTFIYDQPTAPINITNGPPAVSTWYAGQGWSNAVVSIGLKLVTNVGIEENIAVEGIAFPNPTNDNVTVSVSATGNANLTITDLSGRAAYNGALDLTTGKANVDMSNLQSGMYIFNITFENGQKSQFNVVKK